ncbi:MAG: hypothetical protein JSV03_01010, partial [Planctomycetota bacterium]
MHLTDQRIWISKALIGLVCLMLGGLIGRLVYIHAQLSPQLLEWSHKRPCTEIELPGRRGTILDRKFRVLAGSHNRSTIYADPLLVEDRSNTAERLAVILDMSAEEIRNLLDHPTSPRYVIIRRQAEQVEADTIVSLGIPGIEVGDEPARVYPMGMLAAHVLGFVGTDGKGLEGMELAFDRYLRPTSGKRVVFRDVRRRAMFQEEDSYVPAQNG